MNADQNTEALIRLASGRSIEGLGLGERNGRVNLNGLTVPQPTAIKPLLLAFADVVSVQGLIEIRGRVLRSMDFTGGRLDSLRFFDSSMSDCIFDECRCRDWRAWGTTFEGCRFREADLREAALGGVIGGKVNIFRNVAFIETDFRQTAFSAAQFVGCAFENCNLTKVNFGGSSFTDCVFEGELREVCFNRTAFGYESLKPNEMAGVDFSRAVLRMTEFRCLNMENVRFPADNGHIIVDDYPATLDNLIQVFESRTDMGSKGLVVDLTMLRKWAGSKQRRGVLNKKDLIEFGGEERTAELLKLIGA